MVQPGKKHGESTLALPGFWFPSQKVVATDAPPITGAGGWCVEAPGPCSGLGFGAAQRAPAQLAGPGAAHVHGAFSGIP